MSASRSLLASLPWALQRELVQRRAWLSQDPRRAFYWLLDRLRRHPHDPELNRHMALSTQQLGERSLARGYLAQALHVSGGPNRLRCSYLELLIQEGRVERALSTGLRWLRQSPDDRALLMTVGYAAEKCWGHEASLMYYELAFALGERTTFSHFLLTRAVYEVRGAEAAAPYVAHHLNTYPQDPDPRAWSLCAEVLSDLQSRAPAVEHERWELQVIDAYQRALRCDPEHTQAHSQLAIRYEGQDDERAYTHALRARGPEAEPSLYLLLCRLELKRGDLDAARYALMLHDRQNKGDMTLERARLEQLLRGDRER